MKELLSKFPEEGVRCRKQMTEKQPMSKWRNSSETAGKK
jgi:hypothetical protein